MIGIFGEDVWSGMLIFFSSSCIRSLMDWIGKDSLITPPLKSNTRKELRSVLDVRNTITGSEDPQIFVTEQEHIVNPSKHFIAFPCKLFGEFRVLSRQHSVSWQACLVTTGARNPKIWNSIPRGNTFFQVSLSHARKKTRNIFLQVCLFVTCSIDDVLQISLWERRSLSNLPHLQRVASKPSWQQCPISTRVISYQIPPCNCDWNDGVWPWNRIPVSWTNVELAWCTLPCWRSLYFFFFLFTVYVILIVHGVRLWPLPLLLWLSPSRTPPNGWGLWTGNETKSQINAAAVV